MPGESKNNSVVKSCRSMVYATLSESTFCIPGIRIEVNLIIYCIKTYLIDFNLLTSVFYLAKLPFSQWEILP
jgi:hypothetical protein